MNLFSLSVKTEYGICSLAAWLFVRSMSMFASAFVVSRSFSCGGGIISISDLGETVAIVEKRKRMIFGIENAKIE